MASECRRFDGKAAIVTGAASGIGLATAKRLGKEGCRVVIADLKHSDEAVQQVVAEGAPEAISVACDVSSEEQVQDTVRQTIDRWKRLDVVVNNAGLMVFKPLIEHT